MYVEAHAWGAVGARRGWRTTMAAPAAPEEDEAWELSPPSSEAPSDKYGPMTEAHIVDAYPGPVPPVRPRAPPRPSEVYWCVAWTHRQGHGGDSAHGILAYHAASLYHVAVLP